MDAVKLSNPLKVMMQEGSSTECWLGAAVAQSASPGVDKSIEVFWCPFILERILMGEYWGKEMFYMILMLSKFNSKKIPQHYYKHEFQTFKGPSRINLTKESEAYSRFQSQHSLHSRFPAMRLGLGVENSFRFPSKCVSLSHMMPSRQNEYNWVRLHV